MIVNEFNFHVSPEKVKALLEKIQKLNIDLRQIEETFVRGGGKGGQKVNKSNNAVVLRYAPYGLTIKVHRERDRNLNRFLALRELVERVEMKVDPKASERMKEWEKIRRGKERRMRRSAKKVSPT